MKSNEEMLVPTHISTETLRIFEPEVNNLDIEDFHVGALHIFFEPSSLTVQ